MRRNPGQEEAMKTIDDLIKELPPEYREEVEDFIDSLLERHPKKNHGKPTFGWAGVLRDLKGKYTSVELQHRISEWRVGGE
jgi:hypothetical protein